MHKKALFTNSRNNILEFKKAKNRVTTTVKRTKKSFHSNKLLSSSSPKDIWKIMKTVLPPKCYDFFNPNLKTSIFYSYFTTIGNNLTNDLSDDNVLPFDNKSVKQLNSMIYLFLLFVNAQLALKLIHQLIFWIWMLSFFEYLFVTSIIFPSKLAMSHLILNWLVSLLSIRVRVTNQNWVITGPFQSFHT